MVRSGTRDDANGHQSLGELVALAAKDISQLVRYEVSLAKSEMRMDVRRVAVTAAFAAIAALFLALIAFALIFAYAYGLEAAGVWGGLWGAFLIVAATLAVLFGIAVLVAALVIRRFTGMRLTRKSIQDNIEMLRRDEVTPDGSRPAIKNPRAAKNAQSVQAGATAELSARQLPGMSPMVQPSESAVQISGPWQHRSVSANGTRFHVAVSGEGPLVLLLHGFPEFWWTWRHQLVSLSAAGYRAVAVDLRGYGGSDKPPRGYDLITAAADAAGLIRALGEANAIVVGHDWGGLTAWTLAAYFPKAVRRLAIVSMAHPLRMRAAVLSSPLRISRSLRLQPSPGAPVSREHAGWGPAGYPLAFQLPMLPERQLVRDDAALVGSILSSWSAPGWPDAETSRVYQRAMRIPPVAHTSLEYHRWFVRSSLRPDGLRYARQMRTPVAAPVLHLHGALDPCVLPQTARGAGRHVEAPYRWKVIEGAGHFPHEERPVLFDAELLGWLSDPEPDR